MAGLSLDRVNSWAVSGKMTFWLPKGSFQWTEPRHHGEIRRQKRTLSVPADSVFDSSNKVYIRQYPVCDHAEGCRVPVDMRCCHGERD
jgi:hypothetical protein